MADDRLEDKGAHPFAPVDQTAGTSSDAPGPQANLTPGFQKVASDPPDRPVAGFGASPKDGSGERPGLRWANEHLPVPGDRGRAYSPPTYAPQARGYPAFPPQPWPSYPPQWPSYPPQWPSYPPPWPPYPAQAGWPQQAGWAPQSPPTPAPWPSYSPQLGPAPLWAQPGQPQPAAWQANSWQRPHPETATWPAPAASGAAAPAWSGPSATWNLPAGGFAGAWTRGAASAWPTARPEAWSIAGSRLVGSPGSWPVGFVPWGYSNPPPVPPVVEAPGRFHPGAPVRRLLSVAGRSNPRSYRLGLIFGLPAGLVLLAFEIAARGGFKLVGSPLPAGVLLELIGILAALGLIAAALAQSGQRRADGWRDFVGPSPFLVGAAQYACIFALSLPTVALLNWIGIKTSSAVATLLLMPIYLATYVGLVHLLGVRTGALTWSDIIHPKRFSPEPEEWTTRSITERQGWRPRTSRLRTWLRGPLGDFLLAASMLIPVMFASGLTNVVLLAVLGLNGNDVQSDVPIHPSASDVAMIFVSFAILIPIGEEILFRGYSTNAWARSLNGNSALIRAALFFAFVHVINTDSTDAWTSIRVAVDNFGARVPVALALCWIYMRRRSLVASASLHGCYNGLIVLISAWATFQT